MTDGEINGFEASPSRVSLTFSDRLTDATRGSKLGDDTFYISGRALRRLLEDMRIKEHRDALPPAIPLPPDPLMVRRREKAAFSLAEALLDLDDEIARGETPSADQIGNVTLRQALQGLAAPELTEAARMKYLELLTALRTKKLVQKTSKSDPEPAKPSPFTTPK